MKLTSLTVLMNEWNVKFLNVQLTTVDFEFSVQWLYLSFDKINYPTYLLCSVHNHSLEANEWKQSIVYNLYCCSLYPQRMTNYCKKKHNGDFSTVKFNPYLSSILSVIFGLTKPNGCLNHDKHNVVVALSEKCSITDWFWCQNWKYRKVFLHSPCLQTHKHSQLANLQTNYQDN